MAGGSRREELAANLSLVHDRIAAAATGVGRDPREITLVVVTKTFPASDIQILHELGVRDIGENRHPEAGSKAADLAGLGIVWHFIGQVQSNKAGPVASYADVVHSVDSVRLVSRLGAGAERSHRVVTCLIQVSLDDPDRAQGRGGVAPRGVAGLAEVLEATSGVRLGGLMGVAPQNAPAGPAFRRLAEIGGELRADHPAATILSAGMSGDFEAAVRAGATHVRVGSAVVGRRPLLR